MITKGKWYSSTAGKVGIVLGIAVVAIGTYFGIQHFRKPKEETKIPDAGAKTETKPNSSATAKPNNPVASKEYTPDQLPNKGVGCGDVKSTFDKVYDYVKCNSDWWTISKDTANGKIKTWTSLASNKTATDLLNNRFA